MSKFRIVTAAQIHLPFLEQHDIHVAKEMLKRKVNDEEIIVMELNGSYIGWLRYSFFWDEIPFMNMLYFLKEHRRKGYGKLLVNYWEKMLLEKGYKRFLTSTMANEEAQHFYRSIGYTDIGSFILPSEPLEIMLMKDL
ncbi:MAG: GNAT family N-acetyltransferase [Spirochaetes bacterium]|nr:GNAT family N-acetyltransferase [Spirochaetota bacterium]MBN2771333.1 GNAT family N-acetyltransferase [Spirochaetota bacterium]